MDYQNGKIYKLVSFETDKVYVGATTQQLYKRRSEHKSHYKTWLISRGINYITSYEIIKYGDFDIILLEECPCDNKSQLHARERYYIEKLDCVNKIIPGRTKKEWIEVNKIKILEHREANKMKMKEKMQCECGSILRKADRNRHYKTKKHISFISTKQL